MRNEIDQQGQRLGQIANRVRQAVIEGGWTPHASAIASTRLGRDVFRAMGHRAEPVPMIPEFRSARNMATGGEHGHSVGVAGTGTIDTLTRRWDGHLVLLVDHRWIVDLSADQFSRPAMDITVDGPIVLYLGPGGLGVLHTDGACSAIIGDGTHLTYRLMDNPGPWEQFPDWTGKHDRFAAAAAAALQELRTTMAVADLPPNEYMTCTVCGQYLNTIDSALTGERTYVHTRHWERHDHKPVAVPSSQAPPAQLLCDFCTDPNPAWIYFGRNLSAGVVDVPEADGKPAEYWMGEKWGACDPCARHLQARDLAGLARSVQRSKHNQRANANRTPDEAAQVLAWKVDMWAKVVPTFSRRRPVVIPAPPVLGPRLLPRIRDRLAQLYDAGLDVFGPAQTFTASPTRPVTLPGVDVGRDGAPFFDMSHISDEQAGRFLAGCAASLRAAELYYVSAQFTDLAQASGRDLPDLTLTEQELPADHGLLMWERPVADVDRGNDVQDPEDPDAIPMKVIACSWRTVPGGVWVTLYAQPEQYLITQDPARLRELFGYLLPVSTGGGLEFGVIAEADDKSNDVLRAVLATWFLIMQPGVADVERQEIGDGKERRRAARAGRRLPWVQIVDLRRQQARRGESDGDRPHRQVSVRFMVRGHWRRQAYGPGRALRRSMYIAPFLKGPEDAPLKTEAAPTVKVLR